MSKTLIVAEKPSVAREIAKALGVAAGKGNRGFIEGPEHILTWALGHLVGIAEPEGQNEAWKGRWSLAQLPMIPTRFALAVLENSRRQFEVVRDLLLDGRVSEVINATDAGREGELIFRRIYMVAGCDKPVRRMWASDMTEQGLKKALAGLMPQETKRNLGLAAFARAEADWLIGMNFSRLFTVKAGDLITVGRVQTPVLKLLVDRRREIEDFRPRDYWTVEAVMALAGAGSGEEFAAVWHEPPEFKENKVWEAERAEALAGKCGGKAGSVLSVTNKAGRQKPPLPFDLTTLQREANTRHGLSAKRTLDIAQSLYETRKLITYPRTDSQYLTEEVFGEVLDHLRAIYHLFPDITRQAASRIQAGGKFECVNNKKVTDHHAIIPTAKKAQIERLPEDERKIYEMVCRRFAATFLPPATYSAATVWVVALDERFKATGKVFKDRGWLVAEPWRAAEDNPLPALKKGDAVDAREVKAVARQTKPPAHYTDASLLAAMETAGKLVEEEALREAMKDRGLGTPATRAQIIETLLSRNYVEKQGKKLVATDKGLRAVDIVAGLLPEVASPELTGDWERRLKEIEVGTYTYPAFMGSIRTMVRDNVLAIRDRGLGSVRRKAAPAGQGTGNAAGTEPRDAGPDNDAPDSRPKTARPASKGEPLGACPLCGGQVVEGERGYGCSRWRPEDGGCRFVVWKSMNGGTVSPAAIRDLLKNGRTYRRIRFKTREGKKYNAFLRLKDGQVELLFE